MADEFAGISVHPGQNTDSFKTVDTTPPPRTPEPPKPPVNWGDKTPTYKMAHDARKR